MPKGAISGGGSRRGRSPHHFSTYYFSTVKIVLAMYGSLCHYMVLMGVAGRLI